MDKRPVMTTEKVDTLYDAKYIRLYDLRYEEGKHYFDATRRPVEQIVAVKSDEEFQKMLPDAVTIAVIVRLPGEEPKLLMNYEYRYPVGQFLLSPIAGLIDPEDAAESEPLKAAAVREIFEETGIRMGKDDTITVLNPCAFSSPGMTDESNAFLAADVTLSDLSELSQTNCVGTELFNGFEFLAKSQAAEIFRSGRDRFGNTFSIATWVVLSYFAFVYEA